MKLNDLNSELIKALCLSNNVKSLFAFGSITNELFREDSDVDLVVEIGDKNPIEYSDHYFNLKFELEKILKRKVDLLEDKAIKNQFLRDEIEKTKVLVYAS